MKSVLLPEPFGPITGKNLALTEPQRDAGKCDDATESNRDVDQFDAHRTTEGHSTRSALVPIPASPCGARINTATSVAPKIIPCASLLGR